MAAWFYGQFNDVAAPLAYPFSTDLLLFSGYADHILAVWNSMRCHLHAPAENGRSHSWSTIAAQETRSCIRSLTSSGGSRLKNVGAQPCGDQGFIHIDRTTVKSSHPIIVLEVYLLSQCNVVNLHVLAIYYVRNLRQSKRRSASNTGIRIFRYTYFSSFLFILSIPPTWRSVVTMIPVTSLHLLYKCVGHFPAVIRVVQPVVHNV